MCHYQHTHKQIHQGGHGIILVLLGNGKMMMEYTLASLLRRIFHYFGTHRLRTLEGKAKST